MCFRGSSRPFTRTSHISDHGRYMVFVPFADHHVPHVLAVDEEPGAPAPSCSPCRWIRAASRLWRAAPLARGAGFAALSPAVALREIGLWRVVPQQPIASAVPLHAVAVDHRQGHVSCTQLPLRQKRPEAHGEQEHDECQEVPPHHSRDCVLRRRGWVPPLPLALRSRRSLFRHRFLACWTARTSRILTNAPLFTWSNPCSSWRGAHHGSPLDPRVRRFVPARPGSVQATSRA
jgi:hypothetical protein